MAGKTSVRSSKCECVELLLEFVYANTIIFFNVDEEWLLKYSFPSASHADENLPLFTSISDFNY